MTERTLSTTARDAVRNFTHFAAMVDADAEVIIKRRGRAPLKLVPSESTSTTKNRKDLVRRALSIRSAQAFKGKFASGEACDE